jgi:hypothetical protein
MRGDVRMAESETVGNYHARFMTEVAKCDAPPIADTDQVILYRQGMLPYLRLACRSDAHAHRLTAMEDVHRHALAAEDLKRMAERDRIEGSETVNAPAWAPEPTCKTRCADGQPESDLRIAKHARGAADAPNTSEAGDDDALPSNIVDAHGTPLTNAEVRRHFREGLCFKCHRPGHKSGACRNV